MNLLTKICVGLFVLLIVLAIYLSFPLPVYTEPSIADKQVLEMRSRTCAKALAQQRDMFGKVITVPKACR